MKKYFFKQLPFTLAFCFGLALYLVALPTNENFESLLINISSGFISIPILYIIYELVQLKSKTKLNREIIEYAKMQIDRELLNICHQLIKLIFPYEKQNKSFEGVSHLLSMSIIDISNEFENNKYLGFQALKNWYSSEEKIQKLLDSPFILSKLNDDQVITIISILKNIRAVQDMYSNIDNLYDFTGLHIKGFIVQSGVKINPENSEFPDRYLLLKELGDKKYQVHDFGDFEKFKVPKLLFECSLNSEFTLLWVNQIYATLSCINEWVEQTGSEFLVDSRMYRFRNKVK